MLFVNAHTNAQSTNKEYDSVLAKKLNADPYGMKKYYLVLLKTGPLGKNDNNYVGIFVLNTESKKEAEAMIETDPAVNSKALTAEYYLWYGSASLQQISAMHKKIEKQHF